MRFLKLKERIKAGERDREREEEQCNSETFCFVLKMCLRRCKHIGNGNSSLLSRSVVHKIPRLFAQSMRR